VDQEGVALGPLEERRQFLANGGRTAVLIAVDGRAVGVMGLADAPRPTAPSQPLQVQGLCRPAEREGWRPPSGGHFRFDRKGVGGSGGEAVRSRRSPVASSTHELAWTSGHVMALVTGCGP
jgi:hypothetical protein